MVNNSPVRINEAEIDKSLVHGRFPPRGRPTVRILLSQFSNLLYSRSDMNITKTQLLNFIFEIASQHFIIDVQSIKNFQRTFF